MDDDAMNVAAPVDHVHVTYATSKNEQERSDNSKQETSEEHVMGRESEDSELSVRLRNLEDPFTRRIQWTLGCRSVYCYERLSKIDEGSYGVVCAYILGHSLFGLGVLLLFVFNVLVYCFCLCRVGRAKDKENGVVYALKRIKLKDEREGFPITSLREVNLLLNLQHPNIVNVREVVVGDTMDEIFMVMEYLEHDFRNLMDIMPHPFSQDVSLVAYMHKNWVIHRDLKTSNLLMSAEGILKLCDFGLAREYGDPIKRYTPLVVTLWYRPPELLMGQRVYSTAIDMWSVGCIFGELLRRKILLEGQSELNQLELIVKLLGSPSPEEKRLFESFGNPLQMRFKEGMPNRLREVFLASRFSSEKTAITGNGIDLLSKMLCYDPEKRITAEQALLHPYFQEQPLAVEPSMIQTFPATNEGPRRKRKRSLDLEQEKQREAFADDADRFRM